MSVRSESLVKELGLVGSIDYHVSVTFLPRLSLVALCCLLQHAPLLPSQPCSPLILLCSCSCLPFMHNLVAVAIT